MDLTHMIDRYCSAKTITKSDLVNWMLVQSKRLVTDADVKTLRNLHFDERKILGTMLKASSGGGELPEEIKKAVRDYYGLSDGSKRRITAQSVESRS